MTIDNYSFGRITIDGTLYTSDVIIFPDRVKSPWWRKEGHLLQKSDLDEVVNAGLPFLIVGTGYNGAMVVQQKTEGFLRARGIEVYVETTEKAVKRYNNISSEHPVVAALHLTC